MGIYHNYSSTDFGDQLLEVALRVTGTGMNWTPWDDSLATTGEPAWACLEQTFGVLVNDGLPDIVSVGCCAGNNMYI